MNTYLLFLFLSILAAKLIPHAPSLTPLLALAYCSGVYTRQSNRWILALLVILLANSCADFVLAQFYYYPIFGAWSWFSQLGLLGCLFMGYHRLSSKRYFERQLLRCFVCSHPHLLSVNSGAHVTKRLVSDAQSEFRKKSNLSESSPLLTAAYLSVGYWLFTNLGTFITSGLYPFTGFGLWDCFIRALPFLPTLYLATGLSLSLLTTVYCQPVFRSLRKQSSP